MNDVTTIDQLVALVGRRPGLRKQQLCDALDLDDETVTKLIAAATLSGKIVSRDTLAKNDLMLPEYHAVVSGALSWAAPGTAAAAPVTQQPAEQPASEPATPADPQATSTAAQGAPVREKRTVSREAEATAFLQAHGPSTALQLREAMGIKKGQSITSYLASAIAAGRIVVLDGVYSLAAPGSELIKTRTPVGGSAAHLDSPPSADSPLGGGGGVVVNEEDDTDPDLTWSIFPGGQVAIFTRRGGALRQQLALSQADVDGLYSFLSQTKSVWDAHQAKEPA